MKNVERLAKIIAKDGGENILIHSIPGTRVWLVCQAIEPDKWLLTIMEPDKNVSFNIGTVSTREHLVLWEQLIHRQLDIKARNKSTAKKAKEFREIVHKFTSLPRQYDKYIKVEVSEEAKANKVSRRAKKVNKRSALSVLHFAKLRNHK